MTENQELQAFDETLREFLTEPDQVLVIRGYKKRKNVE